MVHIDSNISSSIVSVKLNFNFFWDNTWDKLSHQDSQKYSPRLLQGIIKNPKNIFKEIMRPCIHWTCRLESIFCGTGKKIEKKVGNLYSSNSMESVGKSWCYFFSLQLENKLLWTNSLSNHRGLEMYWRNLEIWMLLRPYSTKSM